MHTLRDCDGVRLATRRLQLARDANRDRLRRIPELHVESSHGDTPIAIASEI
jgi:hypothetical protein